MVILEKNDESKIESQLKSIPSYYEVKRQQRKEAELKEDDELKKLFLSALNFYNENYPKSFQKRLITWNDKKKDFLINMDLLLKEILEQATIEQLYHMAFIIKYSLDEKNYKRVPTRNRFQGLRGRIIKIIPGGRETMEIKALKDDQQGLNVKIKELESRKREKVNEFEYHLKEVKDAIVEKVVEEREAIEGKQCPYCEKKNPILTSAGMSSHVMHNHKEQYEDYQVFKKDQLWPKKDEAK